MLVHACFYKDISLSFQFSRVTKNRNKIYMYYLLYLSFPPIPILKYSIMWKTRSIYDSVSIFFCCKCSFSSFFYASYSSCLYLMGKKEIKTKREQISFPQIYKTFIHLRCCTFRSILLIIQDDIIITPALVSSYWVVLSNRIFTAMVLWGRKYRGRHVVDK